LAKSGYVKIGHEGRRGGGDGKKGAIFALPRANTNS